MEILRSNLDKLPSPAKTKEIRKQLFVEPQAPRIDQQDIQKVLNIAKGFNLSSDAA